MSATEDTGAEKQAERQPGWIRRRWNAFRNLPLIRTALGPATTLSLAFLTLGGFFAGVVFWGGFNTVLEYTNRTEFCIGCHEMRANVFEELQGTIHAVNRSGVRAQCADCHVPHDWTHKMGRKMQASMEVWGHLFGTISTRELFLNHRRTMAEREWARMEANDSLQCRNCHTAEAMDLTKQNPRAAAAHERFLFTGERTCIQCHRGIAHRLPDMHGVPGWQ
ncbi:NapC/NirT family cytochrome c [Sabulicella glaciei]|uniref:Cytochrome c-type protein n=1 Tax=Sabulicella glaciei TaxID=2984948 RepID=A0ABT3NQ13_9PROT|nr:NapC/NirT family cytochrome c [Roseococcus sp. MDT2-1-1]MCW8084251.1 NapC/NirT family cytochrome c [Roseococcus sp. MDT2-1-1]